jgi:hypothetical protein
MHHRNSIVTGQGGITEDLEAERTLRTDESR